MPSDSQPKNERMGPSDAQLAIKDQHDIVADALGAARLYSRYGGTDAVRRHVPEIVNILRVMGSRYDTPGNNPSILTTTADAISRTYLGRSSDKVVEELSAKSAASEEDTNT